MDINITFTELITDIGVFSILLLISIVLRAKVKVIQKMFIPSAFLAGGLGLLLGPNGFGILPLSDWIATYPAVVLAAIFAAIPLGAVKINFKKSALRIRNMWIYCVFTFLLVYGLGLLFAQSVLTPIFDTPPGFGLMLGVGFIGGHGGATAMGNSFAALGWEDALSLGYASATIALVVAIVGGMAIIKYGLQEGYGSFLKDYNSLSDDLRTGLIPENKRKSLGMITLSPNTVDPLLAHGAIIGLIIIIAYFLQQYIESFFAGVSIPLFTFSLIIALVLQVFLRKSGGNKYVDKAIFDRISASSADIIVFFGIASINMSVVGQYLLPLSILLIFGITLMFISFILLAPRAFKEHGFEKGVFNWGWTTGTAGMGVALLRVVDPDLRTSTIEDYGIAYLLLIPFEIITIAFAPIFVTAGYGWSYITGAIIINIIVLYFAFSRGWFKKSNWSNNSIYKTKHSSIG